jgi:DNA-binding transcriptional LysR family regulator
MIRSFEMAIAIEAHRNFQRAARALGITQPALTRALQTLEGEFGAQLFERSKGECEPTAFGRVVLAHARRVVAEVAEARREIALLQGLEAGELRVGVGHAAPQQWIGGAIGELSAANPNLRVHNVELPGEEHPGALMAGRIDLAVGEAGDLDGYPDLVLARLPQRPGAFFCRKGHPLTKLPKIELHDIAAFPFAGARLTRRIGVHFPEGTTMGTMSADGRFFEPAITCPNWTTIREIVCRSDVVAIRARALVTASENRGELAVLPFEAPWLHTEYAIMWRRDRMPHPALKAFCDAVRRAEAAAMNDTRTIQVAA